MFYIKSKENKFWIKYSEVSNNTTVWIKGYFFSHDLKGLLKSLSEVSRENIGSFIKSIDGHFAIIVKRDDFSFLAVDKVRTTPLFFIRQGDDFFVDYDPKNIVNLPYFDKKINEQVRLELEMSGFAIGNKTVFEDLYSLKAGEVVVFDISGTEYIQYYKYYGEIITESYDVYLSKLYNITMNVFKKLVSNIGDRQIIIPLSAGNDSRLVASALKHLGVENVLCYSYGTKGNFEASIAKNIAEKLNYKWVFVPLSHKTENKFYKSKEYKEYLDYAQTYSSVPYIQGLSTIRYLEDMNLIDGDAIFINGNSGDFISGAHITNLMKSCSELDSKENRKENILNSLIEKHFSLWGCLKNTSNIESVKKDLWNEIVAACGDLSEDNSRDHLYYEYSELIDRQSSYVITGQKVYEYYGFEWRMPLWDDEYINFFVNVPAEYKVNQKLYRDMLKKYNIGDVWGDDIPINRKSISPKWVIPLRFLTKIPFVILGKDRWKKFDKCFFYYWMDVTHMINTTNYFRIIKDMSKEPRNHVSWQCEDYIEKIDNENIIGK